MTFLDDVSKTPRRNSKGQQEGKVICKQHKKAIRLIYQNCLSHMLAFLMKYGCGSILLVVMPNTFCSAQVAYSSSRTFGRPAE